MTVQGYLSLAAQSVTAPREVARLLMSIRLKDDALITALGLVIALNGLITGLSLQITPPSSGLPAIFAEPMAYAALQGLSVLGFIAAMTWTGRAFGGSADLRQIALVVVWLQGLRLLAQLALLVLIPLSSSLSGLLFLVVTALGVWVVTNFLDEAHGLGGTFTALLVLILGTFAMALVISILLVLMGLTPTGMTDYV